MIRDAVIGMVVCALLFVLVGVLRPFRRCSGCCGDCHESCELKNQETR
jgi:hypothetical protein